MTARAKRTKRGPRIVERSDIEVVNTRTRIRRGIWQTKTSCVFCWAVSKFPCPSHSAIGYPVADFVGEPGAPICPKCGGNDREVKTMRRVYIETRGLLGWRHVASYYERLS